MFETHRQWSMSLLRKYKNFNCLSPHIKYGTWPLSIRQTPALLSLNLQTVHGREFKTQASRTQHNLWWNKSLYTNCYLFNNWKDSKDAVRCLHNDCKLFKMNSLNCTVHTKLYKSSTQKESLQRIAPLLAKELNITQQKAYDIANHLDVKYLTNEEILHRVAYTKQIGLTSSEIYSYPMILSRSTKDLKKDFDLIQSFKKFEYISKTYKCSKWLATQPTNLTLSNKTHWSNLPERVEMILSALGPGATVRDLENVNFFRNVTTANAIEKIHILKQHGFNAQDILVKHYLFYTHSVKRLKQLLNDPGNKDLLEMSPKENNEISDTSVLNALMTTLEMPLHEAIKINKLLDSNIDQDENIQRIVCLNKNGFSTPAIVRYPQLLEYTSDTLEEYLELYHRLIDKGYLTHNVKFVDLLKVKPTTHSLEFLNHWTTLEERAECLSEVLMLSVEEINSFHFLEECLHERLDKLFLKIDLLIKYGFTKTQIISTKHLLIFSHYKISNGLQNLQSQGSEVGASEGNIEQLKRNLFSPEKYFKHLTNLSKSDGLKFLLPGKSFPKTDILWHNWNLLEKHGFSKDDIRKAPIALCHDHKSLKHCLVTLPTLEELQPFDQFRQDKFKFLNLLAYYLEKPLNFSGNKVVNSSYSKVVSFLNYKSTCKNTAEISDDIEIDNTIVSNTKELLDNAAPEEVLVKSTIHSENVTDNHPIHQKIIIDNATANTKDVVDNASANTNDNIDIVVLKT